MNFDQFLLEINLQEEVKNIVLDLIKINSNEYNKYAKDLTVKSSSLATYLFIEQLYKSDVYNYHILAIYLLAAYNCYFNYKSLKISDLIYIDTMKCFTRFIDECYVKNNKYYFDRGFWTYRQTNMSIFRIGILEYELLDDYTVSLHIPSDAELTSNNIEESIKLFEDFVVKYYPEYVDKPVYCDTWLLSHELSNYLPSNSRILLFQEYFETIKEDLDALDFYEWVFKCDKSVEITKLKEDTTLQRNLKNALLKGKKVGKALGILKKR